MCNPERVQTARGLFIAGGWSADAIAVVVKMTERRFPPPWSVDEADPELDRRCFIVRDADGQALAYVFFEGQLKNRSASSLLTRDEARRIAANFAKLHATRKENWVVRDASGHALA